MFFHVVMANFYIMSNDIFVSHCWVKWMKLLGHWVIRSSLCDPVATLVCVCVCVCVCVRACVRACMCVCVWALFLLSVYCYHGNFNPHIF